MSMGGLFFGMPPASSGGRARAAAVTPGTIASWLTQARAAAVAGSSTSSTSSTTPRRPAGGSTSPLARALSVGVAAGSRSTGKAAY